MKYLPYILKHLRKTWIRTLSTIAAIALCIFLISVLQTALEAFYGGMENASTERLITRHRVSLDRGHPARLPAAHRRDSWHQARRAVHLVRRRPWAARPAASPTGRTSSRTSPWRPSRTWRCVPEYQLKPDEKAAFMADMRGAVIGPALAKKHGWKIGSTFQLESFIPPYRADRALRVRRAGHL